MVNKKLEEMLLQITPGTPLREGLYNIIDAGIGALIVVGMDESVEKMLDGGFYINCDYTPERMFELAKMDGAIIVDEECKTIIYANVHLQVDRKYSSEESGTRHRTAQRAGKQTGKLVVAVSERRKTISLYKGDMRYKLKNMAEIMNEASQALKTMERYRYVLDKSLANLTILELDDIVTIYDAALVLQRFEMMMRIEEELEGYVVELGAEGRLIELQLEDLAQDIHEEMLEFLSDYKSEEVEYESIITQLREFTNTELLEIENFASVLGYKKSYSSLDNKISPKGYRILGKISKLTKKDIEKLVSNYGELSSIQEAPIEELSDTKLSKLKIKAIKNGLKRLKFTVELEK